MNISKLIEGLSMLRSKYGDLDVVVVSHEADCATKPVLHRASVEALRDEVTEVPDTPYQYMLVIE